MLWKYFLKTQKTHLELENQISEGTLFSSTFKVREKKCPQIFKILPLNAIFGHFENVYVTFLSIPK